MHSRSEINQLAAHSPLMMQYQQPLFHTSFRQVENTNVVSVLFWVLPAGWNCSFEIQFLLCLLNILPLHLEQITALPRGRKEGNSAGYLVGSLSTPHVQKHYKEAQGAKWYVHVLANTKNIQASAKILWSIFQIQDLRNIRKAPRFVFYSFTSTLKCQPKNT